jgi:hypothetical protein
LGDGVDVGGGSPFLAHDGGGSGGESKVFEHFDFEIDYLIFNFVLSVINLLLIFVYSFFLYFF